MDVRLDYNTLGSKELAGWVPSCPDSHWLRCSGAPNPIWFISIGDPLTIWFPGRLLLLFERSVLKFVHWCLFQNWLQSPDSFQSLSWKHIYFHFTHYPRRLAVSPLSHYFPSPTDAYILHVPGHQPPALHQSVFNQELGQSCWSITC